MLNCLLTVCVPFEKSAAHKNGFEVLVHIYYLPVETCALRRNSHGQTKQSDTDTGGRRDVTGAALGSGSGTLYTPALPLPAASQHRVPQPLQLQLQQHNSMR